MSNLEHPSVNKEPNNGNTLEKALIMLEERTKELVYLGNFAQRVVDKMDRQEPGIKEGVKEESDRARVSYPEIFANTSFDIGTQINRIGSLLESIDKSIE